MATTRIKPAVEPAEEAPINTLTFKDVVKLERLRVLEILAAARRGDISNSDDNINRYILRGWVFNRDGVNEDDEVYTATAGA